MRSRDSTRRRRTGAGRLTAAHDGQLVFVMYSSRESSKNEKEKGRRATNGSMWRGERREEKLCCGKEEAAPKNYTKAEVGGDLASTSVLYQFVMCPIRKEHPSPYIRTPYFIVLVPTGASTRGSQHAIQALKRRQIYTHSSQHIQHSSNQCRTQVLCLRTEIKAYLSGSWPVLILGRLLSFCNGSVGLH